MKRDLKLIFADLKFVTEEQMHLLGRAISDSYDQGFEDGFNHAIDELVKLRIEKKADEDVEN